MRKSLFKTPEIKTLPKTLIESFVVPPFSTLDTRQGYWIDRKRMWERYLGDTGATRDAEFGRTYNITKQGLYKQTSMFDPVLVELMYKWFCPNEATIIDPFGGEQTKGIVAGLMNLQYVGIELRQEQVDLNNALSKQYEDVYYICGDSRYTRKLIEDNKFEDFKFNFCLTSPPYFNLEEYSTKKEDLSQVSYDEFLSMLDSIFSSVYLLLENDTFTVVKMGEVRDNKGELYGLVPDFINLMKDIGYKYYNEIILINQSGTGAIRAAGNMKSRKIVKCHQNVLVFYKGDLKKIRDKFPELR